MHSTSVAGHFIKDSNSGVDAWNKNLKERVSISGRRASQAFNRQIGTLAGIKVSRRQSHHGRGLECEGRDWLPRPRTVLSCNRDGPVVEPGKFANWISPPSAVSMVSLWNAITSDSTEHACCIMHACPKADTHSCIPISSKVLCGEDGTEGSGRRGNQAGRRSFLAAVGAAIREARTQRGMSRKHCAIRSCRKRYLAQVESYGGNPSIAFLRRVAMRWDATALVARIGGAQPNRS